MRILFYNHAPELGGAERSLLAMMGRTREAGHEIVLCAPPGPLADAAHHLDLAWHAVSEFEVGYTHNPCTLLKYLGRAALPVRDLVQAGQMFRPELIHANTARSGLIAAQALQVLCRRPALVVHVRDSLQHGRTDRLVSAVIRSQAEAVVAISRFVAETLQVDRRKVWVLHNAIDLQQYACSAAKGQGLRQLLGIAPEAPLLAVAGQITPWKGQLEAMDALAVVRRWLPATHLLVAGSVKFSGSHRRYDNHGYYRELVARSKRADIAGYVHLCEEMDASAIYSAADVLLVPSWAEPFGRVVIEAMSARCPVIATAAGGIPEIIEHGVEGLLVPAIDPVALAHASLQVLGDPALRQRLVSNGSRRVAGRFSLDGYMQQLTTIWEAARSRRAAPYPVAPPWRRVSVLDPYTRQPAALASGPAYSPLVASVPAVVPVHAELPARR
jgi:glycosyltransferase involved in cell wall biosynthesis